MRTYALVRGRMSVLLKQSASVYGPWRVKCETGWYLLFIWSVWLHETNQMDKTNQMNQMNPSHPFRLSRLSRPFPQ